MTQAIPAAPAAPAASAKALEQPDLRAEARNPDTSPARLIELAVHFPEEVAANASLDVLSLADPALWTTVMVHVRWKRAVTALEEAVPQAKHRQARLFAVALVRRYVGLCTFASEWAFLVNPARLEAMCVLAEHHAFGKLGQDEIAAGRLVLRAWKGVSGAGWRTKHLLGAASGMLYQQGREGAKLALTQTTELLRELLGRGMPRGESVARMAKEREWQVATLASLADAKRPPAEDLEAALALLRGGL